MRRDASFGIVGAASAARTSDCDGRQARAIVHRATDGPTVGASIRLRTQGHRPGIEINSNKEPAPPGTWLRIGCAAARHADVVFANLAELGGPREAPVRNRILRRCVHHQNARGPARLKSS